MNYGAQREFIVALNQWQTMSPLCEYCNGSLFLRTVQGLVLLPVAE